MQILLIVNSFASSVNPRNTVAVHQYLARHHSVQVVETNERGHATRFAQDAAQRGMDAVVAFGGDGTLNEVATGLAGSNTALAMLPGGSTNVFVRSLGASNDPIVALQQIGAGLSHDNIYTISLGRANGRYFCFHAGIGYDAAVVELVERRASLKRIVGQPLFAISALQAWYATYNRRYPHFNVEIDGRKIPNGYFTIVLNSNPYTYIGKKAVSLSAAASLDKKLVAVTFRKLTTPLMIRTILQAIRTDGISVSSGVDIRTDVEDVKITFPAPFPYQLDGDYLGEQTSLHIEHCQDALRLVRPIIV
ncbi:MAG: diacylglycerol kinase family protein [Actinomycetota bacterium]|nr:diacylglycerol kinase family protein [Actinomycetota bacterium]